MMFARRAMNSRPLRFRPMRALLGAFALAVALAAPVTHAAAAVDPAIVQARLQEAVSRLNLTPDQQAKLKPAFEELVQGLKAIRDAHAGDTSRSARRAMFRDARPVQQEFEKKVMAVLDDSQEAEWEKMRKETRAKLEAQRKAGRGPE
jgi:hypothetical protein